MKTDLIAHASTTIDAPKSRVWTALVTPSIIKEYMFGSAVKSDWQEGSPITWKGEWEGKQYEDHGTVLRVVPRERLQYTHFSPLSGEPDIPANYHTVTILIEESGNRTHVTLTQDNNASDEA